MQGHDGVPGQFICFYDGWYFDGFQGHIRFQILTADDYGWANVLWLLLLVSGSGVWHVLLMLLDIC